MSQRLTLSETTLNKNSAHFWELSLATRTIPLILNNQKFLLASPISGIGEHRHKTVFTLSEISNSAVLAGHSLHLKLYQTDSVSPHREQLTLSSHPKIWFLVTTGILDAMVGSSPSHGAISRTLESLLMSALLMFLEAVLSPLAPRPVLMAQPSRSTSASLPQVLQVSLPSNQKFLPMAQLRLDSQSTRTSSVTSQVSTTIPQETRLEVTLSRSSVGDLRVAFTTGSLPTHGVPHGVWMDSSRSSGVNAASMIPHTDALLNSEYKE